MPSAPLTPAPASLVRWRRRLASLLLIGVAVLPSAGTARSVHAAETTRPPNIIFILADDLGYRELGCFGQKRILTPNLDKMARQGMRFTQHYAGNAVCAPSRCVFMTGMHPGHAVIRSNSEVKPEGQLPIPASTQTLAEYLHDRGYATGAFGKWGLGSPGSEGDPVRQGLDRFYGYNCQRHAHSYYPAYLWSNEERVPLKNDPPVPGHGGLDPGADPADPRSYAKYQGVDYAPDHINEQVLKFIRDNKDRPFFCYYPTVIPHVALHVPESALKPYLQLGWKDPPFTRSKGGYTPHFTPRAAYAAMITRLDHYVGNVLKLLDELNLADNTLIVFSSDNGATHLNEEVDVDFFNSVGELRGLKGSLHEGGIRVPTIVRWPGHTPPGSESSLVSGFEDWLPTFAEVAGVEKTPVGIDGMSLAATLQGKKQPPREFLYREFPSYGGQQMVRVGDWKAIRTNLRSGAIHTQLYNLADDPSEKTDLAAEQPDRVAAMELLLKEQHTPSKTFPLPTIDP
ncbi:arylsulfatase [Lignipirellula cremea]|uniref:Arylsulfatase n=1 Tax=Lignipirellula cremea TaxID=2528010 RepID=A0A518DP20_9BACT|nr:arylsulfatase [Lignipirellula cremea]QDU93553.1 Arylsulfatase [Lignipirellula cremea]